MEALYAHFLGDYVFQNHWMAMQKTGRWLPALVHAAIYTIAFWLLLSPHWQALAVIGGTHLIIDRFRLARYWCEWWGIGQPGKLWFYIGGAWRTFTVMGGSAFEPDEGKAPPFLGVWLLIIVDNVMHVGINALALQYLGG